MTNVKATCGECEGTGITESIRHPFGGYGPNHTEPDYQESQCEECGGNGYNIVTRAEHLALSLAKMDAKRMVKAALELRARLASAARTREAIEFAARIAELV